MPAILGDLPAPILSFILQLRATNKSDNSVAVYHGAPLLFAEFLAERGMPTDVASIRRDHFEAFVTDQTTTPQVPPISVTAHSNSSFADS
jgi:hypothetical protein